MILGDKIIISNFEMLVNMKIEIRESMAKTALCKNASGVKSRRLNPIYFLYQFQLE